ncbi:MAG: hypothetical protein ACPHOJ_05885 [Litorivicinaceae bacterium]
MAVATNDAIDGAVVQVFPCGTIRARHQPGDLIIALVILPTYQVTIVVHAGERGVFPWCRDPTLRVDGSDLGVEGLSLLHTLHVGLETASQALR